MIELACRASLCQQKLDQPRLMNLENLFHHEEHEDHEDNSMGCIIFRARQNGES
jgi:hypothetical protein